MHMIAFSSFRSDDCRKRDAIRESNKRVDIAMTAISFDSSGQGIVFERSPYSDFVFAEAMHKAGYLSDYDKEIYDKMRRNAREDILKPHLVIYLDAPIDILQQRIKSRGLVREREAFLSVVLKRKAAGRYIEISGTQLISCCQQEFLMKNYFSAALRAEY